MAFEGGDLVTAPPSRNNEERRHELRGMKSGLSNQGAKRGIGAEASRPIHPRQIYVSDAKHI
ncbi:MAG: hypothetical protein NVS1B3_02410 [Candidatus Dormibacteraceae bacterium]